MFKFKNLYFKNKYLLVSWTIFVFVLIAWPMQNYKGDVITFYDKIVHALLFGTFYYLLFIFLRENKKLAYYKIFLISFAVSVLYSAFGEFIQNYVPGRTVSEYDFFAGVAGIFLTSIITYVQFRKYEVPRGYKVPRG